MQTFLATRSRPSGPLHITGHRLEAKKEQLTRGKLLERYLENLGVSKSVRNVKRASQGRITTMDDLDSFMQTCSIPSDIDNTGATLWRDNETTYTMNEFTCPSYSNGEASYSKKDLFQPAKWRLHEPFSPINDRSKFTVTTTDELLQPHTENPTLGLDDVPPKTADVELKIVRTWLAKLWMAFQDPSSTSNPEDGAEYGSRDQQSGRERSKKKSGNQESSNTTMSSQESSKAGQKRSRQPPRTPDSDDEADDDGDPKKPGGGGFRGRGPRMLNEFGCPFFKHDPETHGGRGGCREYSHISVGILLRVSLSGIGRRHHIQPPGGFQMKADSSRTTLGSNTFETMTWTRQHGLN
jgi:hypothetical protein